ncbi:uncharacterized protein J3D65DRAFT_672807 [Phyllosticta citribraziliensis]|uniref:EKC/KEOPS complex subunit GON7 n=1 Tax=Phyllosticta citribraziliensis TaxID=989973 RepID=A0ABR1MBQ4_9PEZI
MADSTHALTATYTSPNDAAPKTFSRDLPTVSSDPSTDEKTAYLAALRNRVSELQADVNAYVTQKMEEDKKSAGDDVNDAALEANYGEENRAYTIG